LGKAKVEWSHTLHDANATSISLHNISISSAFSSPSIFVCVFPNTTSCVVFLPLVSERWFFLRDDPMRDSFVFQWLLLGGKHRTISHLTISQE